jgi:hypothetical protein
VKLTAVVYDRKLQSTAQLCEASKAHYWSGLLNVVDCKTVDADTAFSEFCKISRWHVDTYIPKKTAGNKKIHCT